MQNNILNAIGNKNHVGNETIQDIVSTVTQAIQENNQAITHVSTAQDLPTTSPIDTLVYVKATTSFWQNTANGWVNTEADISNVETKLLTPLEI